MLTDIEEYQLTFQIEMIKERGSFILSRLDCYQRDHNIAFDDTSHILTLIGHDLAFVLNTKIYSAKTFEEITRYNGYVDGIKRLLDLMESQEALNEHHTI